MTPSIAYNATIVGPSPSGLGVYASELLYHLESHYKGIRVYTSFPEGCRVHHSSVRKLSSFVQPNLGARGHVIRLLWLQFMLPWKLVREETSLLFSPLPEGMLTSTIPQIVVVHDPLPLLFPSEYPRQQYYFRFLVRAMTKRARTVVAVSENTKRDIMKFYGVPSWNIQVIYPGHNPEQFHASIDPSSIVQKYGLKRYFLYVGNHLPHKNLKRLIQAFSHVHTFIPHQLVIAGKKDVRYSPALEAQCEVGHLHKRVVFLDYFPSHELPGLYAGAEALVFPSLGEGFGLPLVEAMACGVPVITSGASSMLEVVGRAGVLVDPYNIEQIGEAMVTVANDPNIREEMKGNGLSCVGDFTWGRAAHEMSQLFNREGFSAT